MKAKKNFTKIVAQKRLKKAKKEWVASLNGESKRKQNKEILAHFHC